MLFVSFHLKQIRIRSTILGQRKPKTNKRKKKKRTAERRYSEGEASDYDETSKPCEGSTGNESSETAEKNRITEQRDSGVDFGGDSCDDISKKPKQKSNNKSRGYDKKSNGSDNSDEIGLEMEFKSGMMFDIEM